MQCYYPIITNKKLVHPLSNPSTQMIIQIIQLSLLALIVTLVLYFIGSTFINIISKTSLKIPRSLFFSIFWGSLITVSLTAVIRTGFSSVFLLTIIPASFIIYQKPKFDIISWSEWRIQMLSVPFLFLFFLTFLIFFPYTNNVEGDMPFYGKVAESLITLGIENTNHYFNTITLSGNATYHYFELWFTGIIGWLTNGTFTYVLVYKYFTLPLFISYITLAVFSLLKNKKSAIQFWLSIIVISVAVLINFAPLVNFGNPAWGITHFIFGRTNFVFFYFALLPAFIYYLHHNNLSIFIGYLLFLPILTITTAPVIFSSTIIFISIVYFARLRLLSKIKTLQTLGVILFTGLATVTFYALTGDSVVDRIANDPSSQSFFSTLISIWKAIIHQLITLSLRLLLFATIAVLIILKIRNLISREFYILLSYATLSGLMGVILFQIIPTIDNAYQIPYIGYSAVGVVTIIAIINFYHNGTIYYKFGLVIAVLALAINSNIRRYTPVDQIHSIEYLHLTQRGYTLKQIKEFHKLLSSEPNKILEGGFYAKPEHIKKPIVYQRGNDFYILRNNFHLYPITPIKFDERPDLKHLKDQFPFYNNFDAVNQVKYTNQYIQDNCLQFVISDVEIEGLEVPLIVF